MIAKRTATILLLTSVLALSSACTSIHSLHADGSIGKDLLENKSPDNGSPAEPSKPAGSTDKVYEMLLAIPQEEDPPLVKVYGVLVGGIQVAATTVLFPVSLLYL